jgi:hypothetical protein
LCSYFWVFWLLVLLYFLRQEPIKNLEKSRNQVLL